jgi:hypothetical protein
MLLPLKGYFYKKLRRNVTVGGVSIFVVAEGAGRIFTGEMDE